MKSFRVSPAGIWEGREVSDQNSPRKGKTSSKTSDAAIHSFATFDMPPVSHVLRPRRRTTYAFRPDYLSCWWKPLSRLGSGVVSFMPSSSVHACPLWGCYSKTNTLCRTKIRCYISEKLICCNFLPFPRKPNFTEHWHITFWSLNRKISIFQQCITGKDLSFFQHNVILGSVY